MRLGIEVSQKPRQFLLIDFPGRVLAQGRSQPLGNLGVFQGFGCDDGPDNDLAAGVLCLCPCFEAGQFCLSLSYLLFNRPHHFAALLLVPVVLLSGT